MLCAVCCVFCAFVALWMEQMTTGLVPCVNHHARVLFIQGTPRSFVWVSTLCLCYVFVWSSSPCLYTARRNLGLNKKNYYAFLRLSPESIYTNVTCIFFCIIPMYLLGKCFEGIILLEVYVVYDYQPSLNIRSQVAELTGA